MHTLCAGGGRNALDQNLDSRPRLVDDSLDHAGRGIKATRSASRQLVGVRIRHHADTIGKVVASSIRVVYGIEILNHILNAHEKLAIHSQRVSPELPTS
jgi:hypothetical protein